MDNNYGIEYLNFEADYDSDESDSVKVYNDLYEVKLVDYNPTIKYLKQT